MTRRDGKIHLNRPVRIGVVGAGIMGCNHARVLSELPGADQSDTDLATTPLVLLQETVYQHLSNSLSESWRSSGPDHSARRPRGDVSAQASLDSAL